MKTISQLVAATVKRSATDARQTYTEGRETPGDRHRDVVVMRDPQARVTAHENMRDMVFRTRVRA